MKRKKCYICNRNRLIKFFAKKRKTHHSYCKDCKNKYTRNIYRENPNKRINEIKDWRHANIVWYKNYKLKLKCSRCQENHPDCLDFHHRNPKEKSFQIANSVKRVALKRLQEEILKCDVLCCNCHRKEHSKLGRVAESEQAPP